jgi:hypothetical protein
MPFVLLTILKLNKLDKVSRIKNFYIYVVLSGLAFSGLVLSHNAISLLFIPFLMFYIIYLFTQHYSKLKFLLSFFSLCLGLLFSFFFWFPAFFEGKYTLRDIVTKGEYAKHFIEPSALLFGPWEFGGSGIFSVQLGIAHIILLLLSIFITTTLIRGRDKKLMLVLGSIFLFFCSIILMLRETKFIWETVTTLGSYCSLQTE